MNGITIALGIMVGVPLLIIGLWILYRIAIAVFSAGSYDRGRRKECDKTTIDDDCATCASYTVIGGQVYCSKHNIRGE